MKKRYKGVPVQAARYIANEYDKAQVIVVTWDKIYGKQHVTTYGQTVEECAQAAEGGNRVKKALGWPDELFAQPPRVKALHARIKALEAVLKKIRPGMSEFTHHETCEAHDDGECTTDCGPDGTPCPTLEKCECTAGDYRFIDEVLSKEKR